MYPLLREECWDVVRARGCRCAGGGDGARVARPDAICWMVGGDGILGRAWVWPRSSSGVVKYAYAVVLRHVLSTMSSL